MIQFRVMNRKSAEERCKYNYGNTTAIVSIGDIGAIVNYKIFIGEEVKATLRLQFEDNDNGPNIITENDAIKIINFVNKWQDWVSEIIIHCEAGISRSAGVAAALMYCFNGDNSPIFEDKRFVPNMTCYRTVVSTFYNMKDNGENGC